MKKDNDNEERLIETIVTIGTLIFFGFLSMYAMRGCSGDIAYMDNDVRPATAIVSTATTEATNMEVDATTSTTTPQGVSADINGSAEVDEDLNTTANEDEHSDDNATIGADVPEKDSVKNLANDENKDAEVDSNTSADNHVPKNSTSEAKEEAGIIADINSASISAKPYILKGIYFRSGSSILTKKSKRQLDAIAKALKAHKDVKVTIRGHTDSKGSKKANLTLSLKRASSTGMALVDRGVNIDNIWIDGMGETEPITKNGTAKEMLLNRRVDIAVSE